MRKIWLVVPLFLLLSSCSILYTVLVDEENCERYSIYRRWLFLEDDLLWEKTACDSDRSELETAYKKALEKYEKSYGEEKIYSEHVTYSSE